MKVWKLVFLRTWGQKRNTISFQTCQIWRGTNENSKRASRNTLHLPGIVHRAIQENWRNGKTDITSHKTISDVPYEHLKTRYNLRMKQTRNNIKWATQECVQGQWRSWGGIRCQEGAVRVIVKIAHAAISFRNAPRQKRKKIKINIQASQLLLFLFSLFDFPFLLYHRDLISWYEVKGEEDESNTQLTNSKSPSMKGRCILTGFSGWALAPRIDGGITATGAGSWLGADITVRAITPTVEPVPIENAVRNLISASLSIIKGKTRRREKRGDPNYFTRRNLIQLALQVAFKSFLFFRRHGNGLGDGRSRWNWCGRSTIHRELLSILLFEMIKKQRTIFALIRLTIRSLVSYISKQVINLEFRHKSQLCG